MWVTFSSHCLSLQRVMYKGFRKKLRWMTTRSVHVSSLLSRFFPAEQSLAKWSLLTTLTWHWHGDVFKISRNLLFGVFVYATAAPPLYSPSGCPPFLVVSEKNCVKSLHPTIFLSLLCTAKCPRHLFNKLEGWASTQKMAVSPNSLRFGLLLAREHNVYFTLYINDIFIHHTGYNYNLH